MTTTSAPTSRSTRRSPAQLTALLMGAVFLLVGVAGFVPGITTHYDTMSGAGHHSGAMLLGLFQVSVLHNVIHLLYGVAGVLAARAGKAARLYLLAGGAGYAVVWVYGLVVDQNSSANFVPLNSADNWLHLALALGMVLLGLLMPTRTEFPTAAHAPSHGEGR